MDFRIIFYADSDKDVVNLPGVPVGLTLLKKHYPAALRSVSDRTQLVPDIRFLHSHVVPLTLTMPEVRRLNEEFGIFEVDFELNDFFYLKLVKSERKHELVYTLDRDKLFTTWISAGAPKEWHNLSLGKGAE